MQTGNQLSTYKADKLSDSNLRNLVSTGNPRITTLHKLPTLKKVQNLDKDQVRMKPLEDNDDNVIVVVLFSKENLITKKIIKRITFFLQ